MDTIKNENTQVQNLANAINSYMDSKLATIGGGSAAPVIIGSVSSTVEGAIWLEDDTNET